MFVTPSVLHVVIIRHADFGVKHQARRAEAPGARAGSRWKNPASELARLGGEKTQFANRWNFYRQDQDGTLGVARHLAALAAPLWRPVSLECL